MVTSAGALAEPHDPALDLMSKQLVEEQLALVTYGDKHALVELPAGSPLGLTLDDEGAPVHVLTARGFDEAPEVHEAEAFGWAESPIRIEIE